MTKFESNIAIKSSKQLRFGIINTHNPTLINEHATF